MVIANMVIAEPFVSAFVERPHFPLSGIIGKVCERDIAVRVRA